MERNDYNKLVNIFFKLIFKKAQYCEIMEEKVIAEDRRI